MSIKKNKNQLIISILVGLAIFIITYLFVVKKKKKTVKQEETIKKLTQSAEAYAMNPESTTFYVVAKKDLPKDHVITADDIEMKYLEMKISGACTNSKLAIGAKTSSETKKGRPVILKDIVKKENLSSEDEPRPGYRAVAATIAANKIPPFVKNNTYLDVNTKKNTFQAPMDSPRRLKAGSLKRKKIYCHTQKSHPVQNRNGFFHTINSPPSAPGYTGTAPGFPCGSGPRL